MSLFLNSYFFGWQNIGGGGPLPPPPVPTAMGIHYWQYLGLEWLDTSPCYRHAHDYQCTPVPLQC